MATQGPEQQPWSDRLVELSANCIDWAAFIMLPDFAERALLQSPGVLPWLQGGAQLAQNLPAAVGMGVGGLVLGLAWGGPVDLRRVRIGHAVVGTFTGVALGLLGSSVFQASGPLGWVGHVLVTGLPLLAAGFAVDLRERGFADLDRVFDRIGVFAAAAAGSLLYIPGAAGFWLTAAALIGGAAAALVAEGTILRAMQREMLNDGMTRVVAGVGAAVGLVASFFPEIQSQYRLIEAVSLGLVVTLGRMALEQYLFPPGEPPAEVIPPRPAPHPTGPPTRHRASQGSGMTTREGQPLIQREPGERGRLTRGFIAADPGLAL